MPSAPYSYASRTSNGIVATAGIVAIDGAGQTIGKGDPKAQTRHILETIEKILEASNCTMQNVFQVQIFVSDFADYGAVNQVYQEFFEPPYPPRYCVKAELVKDDWLVEIAVLAMS